jgi:hypothetical protein
LDRIVTRARAEVPFRPSLPGSIPESPNEGSIANFDQETPEETMRRKLGDMRFDGDDRSGFGHRNNNNGDRIGLMRRNSAPINF